jgi:lysophospholipase L1-like esterase
MQQIFLYSDSVSWGVIPNTRERFEFNKRWTGICENSLNEKGYETRFVEDCLNGRRTAWEDPKKPGRNGLIGISQKIETYSPLDLIIVFLGTNDFQAIHQVTSKHSAQGLSTLITKIKNSPIEPTLKIPEILVIAPPLVLSPAGVLAQKFKGSKKKCKNLAYELRKVATEEGCHFFDSNSVITASKLDGVHLDEDQHETLGFAICEIIENILDKPTT